MVNLWEEIARSVKWELEDRLLRDIDSRAWGRCSFCFNSVDLRFSASHILDDHA